MPIEIIDQKGSDLTNFVVQNVVTSDGKTVGKFRSNSGVNGLALLKVDECLQASDGLELSEARLSIKCWKPFWWPKESKQSLSSRKSDQMVQ